MQQGQYIIESCKGEGQSTYNVIFYIVEGRKEVVTKTSEHIDSVEKKAETNEIIKVHESFIEQCCSDV